MIGKQKFITILIFSFVMLTANAQDRPFIWVKQSERAAILEKIQNQHWAASLYKIFIERLDAEFSQYQKDPQTFFEGILLNVKDAKPGISPPLKIVDYKIKGVSTEAKIHMRYLQVAIDCGIAYYLTQDENYAQCALDVLNAYVVGLNQIPLDTGSVMSHKTNEQKIGGWLYSNGQHLREAREIGAQIPMIYDFVAPFIKQGGMPYDLGQKAKVDFPQKQAQQVFRTYAMLTVERGMTGTNWLVLEAASMVQHLLALENKKERDTFLKIYLTTGSELQDPHTVVAEGFAEKGDVYPETSQYSNGVASLSTYLMTILTKYHPSLHLGQKYVNIPIAISRWEDMKYPNEEIVLFGDGHRHGGTNFEDFEFSYYLGQIDDVQELI